MTRKLVTDMSAERFQVWRELLDKDRALSHQAGILAVRRPGDKFVAGALRTDLSISRDRDYQAMQQYPDGQAFDYSYKESIRAATGNEVEVAPGRYACLLVVDNAVQLGSLRSRVEELLEAEQEQAAAVTLSEGLSDEAAPQPVVLPDVSPETQPGAA